MTDITAPILGSSVLLGPVGLAHGIRPYYQDAAVTIYHGDNRVIMPQLAPFDLLLTDPPYGIGADNRKRILSRGKLAAAKDYGEQNWDADVVDEWVMFLARRLGRKQIIFGGKLLRPASDEMLAGMGQAKRGE
jgi:hypothetical protein